MEATLDLPHDSQTSSLAGLQPRQLVRAGQVLFVQGQACHALAIVRCGALKTSVTQANGRVQVCGFHMPGDVLALDGIADARHTSTATALEDTRVSLHGYDPIGGLAQHDLVLRSDLSRLMSLEIVRRYRMLLLLGQTSAPERLAAFLLDLSCRFQALGHSPREFNLRMTRADIASFLGMTLETVSRTLSAFQQDGALEVGHRHIRFTDLERFRHEHLMT